MDREALRERIEELRRTLARLEDLQRRQDHEAWVQFQRERAEAIKQSEQISDALRQY